MPAEGARKREKKSELNTSGGAEERAGIEGDGEAGCRVRRVRLLGKGGPPFEQEGSAFRVRKARLPPE